MTSESTFRGFYGRGLITDVLNIVKSGKEATIYRCQAHPSTGNEFLVAKVYRPFIHRSFRNDAIYQRGRFVGDERSQRVLKKKTRHGRSWSRIGHAKGIYIDIPKGKRKTINPANPCN